MLKNFFVITFRNFTRNWSYSLINVMGLSVGMTACIIIYLIIDFEKSFDEFHEKRDALYRVVVDSESASGMEHSATLPYPFISAFQSDFAHIPATQIHVQSTMQVSYGAEKIRVNDVVFADSLFTELFTYPVISGNPKVDLGQPGKVFLTQSLNEKINPNGTLKTIKLDNKLELDIAGIITDPPKNSHVQFSMLVSYPSFSSEIINLPIDQWGMSIAGFAYVALPINVEAADVEKQFVGFVKKYYNENSSERTYRLQPISDIHFNTELSSTPNGAPGASSNTLLILGILGGFILLVASINFVNLSTAQAVKKSRETGVRKTLGASRNQLVRQFLGEAFMIATLSGLIAIMLTEVLVAPVGLFLEKELLFSLSGNPLLLVYLVAIVLVTGFFSGLYPAFVLSGFNPVEVLKNKLTNQQSSGAHARQFLVVFQFVIAQALVVGTLVVADQMDFVRSKPLGFAKEAIVNIELPENDFAKSRALKTRLQEIKGVESVSLSLGAPTSESNFSTGFNTPELYKTEKFDTRIKLIDYHYLNTYQLKLVAGRWFNENEEKLTEPSLPAGERKYSYLVNEALVKRLDLANPNDILGRHIVTGLNDIDAEVVGVVQDFHTSSLHMAVEPTVLVHFPHFYYDAGIRVSTANLSETLDAIKTAYAAVYPDNIFHYTFLDEQIESLYRQEERVFTLIQIFAGLSIFISCLGLYGLVSFLTQAKVKEVGIRKVFGASVAQIAILFSRSFVKLIVVAFVIAAPLAWYFMSQWLNGFAYHVNVGLTNVVIGFVATVFVALATMGYQCVSAARANPMNSLRSE